MWNEVGETAGEVWRYVMEHGETSTLKLRSTLKIPQSLLFLALGWLAREEKVDIIYRDRHYWVDRRHDTRL